MTSTTNKDLYTKVYRKMAFIDAPPCECKCALHEDRPCGMFNTDDPITIAALRNLGGDLNNWINLARCQCDNRIDAAMGRSDSVGERYIDPNLPADHVFKQTFDNFSIKDTPDDSKGVRGKVSHSLNQWAYGSSDLPKTVLLYGPVGTGKSHLAISVLREVIDRGLTARYENARELLLDKLVPNYISPIGETGREIVAICKKVDYLVLDDIGTEKASDHTQGSLYDIIESRQRMGKQLLLTTNVTREQSRMQFGDRLHSRFLSGDVLRLALIVDDYRPRLVGLRHNA